ncbi:hypothetical protein [Legionella israelensis]|uniref:Uncharacterized protein n=1 Tax=Legionella israelensis TaxID=454 RepID=A0A0W0VJG4_9GAMM|nr:hypothetical protein [Legionella israelensis]KTD20234.1 hypothetical protein Lisr_1818 [Legionella israelensis]SCY39900.1 hypothetical protein SAMN02746069_02307 [Legionella israelensis DSM 19235]STX58726.1 Uncharacterised protein [Legionella israelensis]
MKPIPRVALPHERFWDIQVTKIDSPTREVFGPRASCLRHVCSERAKRTPSPMMILNVNGSALQRRAVQLLVSRFRAAFIIPLKEDIIIDFTKILVG